MDARVTLYVRDGCHLCDGAREVVREVCADVGVGWAEVDIDADGDASVGAERRAQLSDLVPVVEVDGVQVGYWRIRAATVRAALSLDGGQ